ncbi:extracellular solute-binding protein [Paenibacillus hodogayensis]|uniref:Extracellular solute-binding protein n=1 Tax=Paenibacillus hodogayensis TaxID=279208 RepID=A0ABV5VVJ9_9BACL
MRQIGTKLTMGLTLLTIAMLPVLSACSKDTGSSAAGTTDSPKANSVKPKEPVKLQILTTHAGAEYAKDVKVADDPYIKELGNRSGYDLKFEFLGQGEDFNQQLTVRFASNNLPDLIRTGGIEASTHPGALEQGVFQDLGPLLDKYGPNLKKKIPKEAWDSPQVSKNGKIFGIPAFSALSASKVIYIRQDWLDKLKMPQPKTLDEYVAFFEAVKQNDMNGNGNPNDEYGIYVQENMLYADLFFTEFGVSPHAWHVQNGQMVPDMIRPEMKDAIKFWKMLYDKGYVNPNMFTTKGVDWGAGIWQGKAGLWENDVIQLNSTWSLDRFVNQPGAEVSMIAPPVGPKGKGALSLPFNGIYYVWVIPSSSKHAEDAIKFLDWAWSDEADKFFAYGIEGKNYSVDNGTVKWDPAAPSNAEKGASIFYQIVVNPRGDGRMVPDVLKFTQNGEAITQGIEIAKNAVIQIDNTDMPKLKAFETHPELVPGNGWTIGGLFLDMFAKVVTGKEELEPAFDKFVSEWKRRGGDEAIKEATAWYNSKAKK